MDSFKGGPGVQAGWGIVLHVGRGGAGGGGGW